MENNTDNGIFMWMRITKKEAKILDALLHSFIAEKEENSKDIGLNIPDQYLYMLQDKLSAYSRDNTETEL